jgi:mannosidase alpha-like ER degradation enhancer 1
MESFALSETFKYLYLLFDAAGEPAVANRIFTTEGHLLQPPPARTLTRGHRLVRTKEYAGSSAQCPVYRPANMGGLRVGIKGRKDYDYSATVVGMPLLDDRTYRDAAGWCEVPIADPYVSMSGDF